MIIAGMVNSQTVLLTIAPEQQPGGVQVVKWVGLVRDKELAENLKTFIHECWPILRPDSFIITVQH